MVLNLRDLIEAKAPWLEKRFNGVEWVNKQDALERRVGALEAHIQNLEERYAETESSLLLHSQGQTHRPAKRPLPPPDEG